MDNVILLESIQEDKVLGKKSLRISTELLNNLLKREQIFASHVSEAKGWVESRTFKVYGLACPKSGGNHQYFCNCGTEVECRAGRKGQAVMKDFTYFSKSLKLQPQKVGNHWKVLRKIKRIRFAFQKYNYGFPVKGRTRRHKIYSFFIPQTLLEKGHSVEHQEYTTKGLARFLPSSLV